MITWDEITNELTEHAGYRQAMVTIFRKYEGQETDEIDGSNRVVKVTATSFARHFGIKKQTFADWINPPAPRPAPEPQEQPEPREPLTRPAPQVNPPAEPEQPIRTPAEYKADRAIIDEQLAPLKQMINSLEDSFVFTCGVVGAMEDIVEAMDRVNPQYVTKEEVKEAYELIAVLGEKMMALEQSVNTLAN